MKKGIYILICAILSSCASKQLNSSITSLQKQNQALKSDVANLQSQVNNLTNDLLVIQTRVESAAKVAPPAPAVIAVVAPTEKPKSKPRRETSFFDDDMQFTDEEPSIKFTNKDLSNAPLQVVPSKTNNTNVAPSKPKSEFTEQTLIEDASKKPANVAGDDSGIQDPAIVAAYNKAYRKFKEKNYHDTIVLMSDFLKQFPSHPYSDNATFWIGESFYQMKDYQKAGEDFRKVVEQYPNGNKVPDALLRAGICDLKLAKPEKAKNSFDLLMRKYPESVAAKRAMATLGEL